MTAAEDHRDLDVVELDERSIERVHETPTSLLLFTTDRVYKLRRPLRWPPYLDYSSAGSRHRAARRELERGRRASPNLYLDLVCVVRERCAGETAVMMRRLDSPFQTFLESLRTRRPGELTVEPFLDAVRLHHARGHSLSELPAGCLDLRQRFRILLDECEPLGLLTPTLRRMATSFENDYRPAARLSAGCIRELHGDLHSGNVFTDGQLWLLFDFSDFDDAFVFGDVAVDHGFACADLFATGHLDVNDARLARFADDLRTPLEILLPMAVFGLLNRAAVFAADASSGEHAVEYAATAERIARFVNGSGAASGSRTASRGH